MTGRNTITVERWTPLSIASVTIALAVLIGLGFGPFILGANAIEIGRAHV